ncbi:MAG: hypothetical protein RLZZ127_2483 [Planctomycetota bacterium]|jgi:hypothetical protein
MIRVAAAGIGLMAVAAWLAAEPPPPQIRRTGEVVRPSDLPVERPVSVRRDDAALARAFAWSALRRAGGDPPPLDPAALAALPDAEHLVIAEPPPFAGPALPMPGGGFLAVPAADGTATRTSPDAAAIAAGFHRLPPPALRAPAAVVGTGQHKVIRSPGAVAMVAWDPAEAPGALEISDRSGGHHGLRILADDYGSVRLDGGLVAPGRLYRIHGRGRITADVPVRVEIRPLAAAATWWDGPVVIPVGGG